MIVYYIGEYDYQKTEEDKEMLGVIESVARKSDCFGLSLNAMVSQIHCKVVNHVVEKQYEKKHKQYQRVIDEAKAQGMVEEGEIRRVI